MACFIAPSILAIIVSIVKRVAKKVSAKINLGLLESLLWSGAGVLTLEHVWHGEVVLWPPFLTAMQSPEEWTVALHEMTTAGITMTLATVGIWGCVLLVEKMIKAPQIQKIVTEKKVITTLST
uniref:Uncharacterized protein n=1 Tax=Ignisphaera aggregans TaxID=334771 RepID=A0A7J3Z9H9_9CREN